MATTLLSELFTVPTDAEAQNWKAIVAKQHCSFLGRKCLKVRKSEPEISIGTCTVKYGREQGDVIICPYRLVERRKIFLDCIHLLTLHEPGNDLHVVPELSIPGGTIDYFLASVRNGIVIDFVGIELQTLDTTGTVWPERQRFLQAHGVKVNPKDTASTKTFGMNWKMTAKTILVQLHHKIKTFEHLNKHLVLVVQNHLLTYMQSAFAFDHISKTARLGDPMHFHSYLLEHSERQYQLKLAERLSTDSAGIATCIGLQAEAKIEMEIIVKAIQAKISDRTLLSI
ncbi:NotI family restriction endonuclease [Flavisolibacter ginsenosidimutans]|uniref:Uncharacterized protein n=1 Tax=Flavisolibacter ginsenosidimutans TaxID=661481 RepID=A0A5B8UPJ5_9BACT|nr:NotI family restriction endonuclease [Flavisolibacter ginsenosidimutans]QEC58159.1 hypothetical protein FSB75_20360 [Flavisolibacter ginsenosidimutans]